MTIEPRQYGEIRPAEAVQDVDLLAAPDIQKAEEEEAEEEEEEEGTEEEEEDDFEEDQEGFAQESEGKKDRQELLGAGDVPSQMRPDMQRVIILITFSD